MFFFLQYIKIKITANIIKPIPIIIDITIIAIFRVFLASDLSGIAYIKKV